MLEVIYNKDTKEVRGWCADEKQFGNFKPTKEQAVVILPIGIPTHSDVYHVDLIKKIVTSNPDYVIPIPRNPLAEIDELKARLDSIETKEVS